MTDLTVEQMCDALAEAHHEDCSDFYWGRVSSPTNKRMANLLASYLDKPKLKPLVWRESERGHWFANTGISCYAVNEGGMQWWRIGSGETHPMESVAHGKQLAEADHVVRIRGQFEST